MCESCAYVCRGLTAPHTSLECQWRRGLRCYRCFCAGHAPSSCPLLDAVPQKLVVVATEAGIKAFLLTQGMKPLSTRDGNIQRLKDIANTMKPLRLLVLQE